MSYREIQLNFSVWEKEGDLREMNRLHQPPLTARTLISTPGKTNKIVLQAIVLVNLSNKIKMMGYFIFVVLLITLYSKSYSSRLEICSQTIILLKVYTKLVLLKVKNHKKRPYLRNATWHKGGDQSNFIHSIDCIKMVQDTQLKNIIKIVIKK